ncbi:MerR family transcriptional regulator [Enterococcus saccharolyticus]|uniref:MerR family transcriptional regulator n=1 Tax=Candidatus Enterococcus willemsii TaxID=1857215 RepID=A0ABQ6YYL2_9ENTE|nr:MULTISPECIES: MerR family transcriptional regulator [Enterococcus]KAF1302735.1 MerR family transcriptional regulator [Enterococcus sp. CU12B]MCD5002409.1 MerR family transcriptional regulator [Enterococcus saccharolyticus]
MYTIGQVSEMFQLPISTLRYYDKEGLFPDMQRVGGIRQFSENELEALRVIDCLKKSGVEIKDIKQFMEWNMQGSETFQQRKELFEKQKQAVEDELRNLEKTLDMIKYKCWYYETAMNDGTEENILAMLPNQLPAEIQACYDHAHL